MYNVCVKLRCLKLQLGKQNFQFDAQFEAGKITAIVGPSGSGKSTMLNLIAGFEKPDSGEILFDDKNVSKEAVSRRGLSFVFQDNNLFAHLDIFTNVALGLSADLKLTSKQKEYVSEALKRVGLGGFEKRFPESLSGGERQRASLARALVQRKPLMLLDEPFAALDPSMRYDMGSLLVDLHSEVKNTILMVSHHPDEVHRLSDNVVFLDNGEILFSGSKVEFFSSNHIEAIEKFTQRTMP